MPDAEDITDQMFDSSAAAKHQEQEVKTPEYFTIPCQMIEKYKISCKEHDEQISGLIFGSEKKKGKQTLLMSGALYLHKPKEFDEDAVDLIIKHHGNITGCICRGEEHSFMVIDMLKRLEAVHGGMKFIVRVDLNLEGFKCFSLSSACEPSWPP